MKVPLPYATSLYISAWLPILGRADQLIPSVEVKTLLAVVVASVVKKSPPAYDNDKNAD